jgi:hypothetical protein
MSTRKPKKCPTALPFNKFLGEWADLVRECQSAEDVVRELRELEARVRSVPPGLVNLISGIGQPATPVPGGILQ